MKHLPLIVLFCAGIGSQLLAQNPDAVWEHFLSPHVEKSGQIAEHDGYAELHTNGTELSFYIQINAPSIAADDHLIIWLGLSPAAFPANFPYQSHPLYVSPPAKHLRGERNFSGRLFSAWNGAGEFRHKYDQEQPDSAELAPWPPSELEWREMPYGLVGYQIFSDGRPAQLVNASEMDALADRWGLKRGRWEDLIRYTAEEQEWGKGMIFNVSVPTQALGFVQVPDHRELGVALDWVKITPEARQGQLASTTSPRADGRHVLGKDLRQIELSAPLFTDLPGIPARVWYQGGRFPICFFATSGWVAVDVGIDALFFRPAYPSTDLLEVSFDLLDLKVEQQVWKGLQLTQLKLRRANIWRLPWEDWWYQLEEQQLALHRIPQTPLLFRDDWFSLPDGTPASLLSQHQRAFPYPWEENSAVWEDETILYRWGKTGLSRMVEIRQIRWPVIRCEIGALGFDDFQIISYDLLPGGRRMVIWLENIQDQKVRKRIKLSWNDAGEAVEVEEIP